MNSIEQLPHRFLVEFTGNQKDTPEKGADLFLRPIRWFVGRRAEVDAKGRVQLQAVASKLLRVALCLLAIPAVLLGLVGSAFLSLSSTHKVTYEKALNAGSASLVQALSFLQESDLGKCVEIVREELETYPERRLPTLPSSLQLAKAVEHLEHKEYEKGLALCKIVLQDDTYRLAALTLAFDLAAKAGRKGEATSYFRQMKKHFSGCLFLKRVNAQSAFNKNKLEKAATLYLEIWTRLNPSERRCAASCFKALGRNREASKFEGAGDRTDTDT